MRNQAWPNRAPAMEIVFRSAFGNKPITGLEIGVWYGLGSTNIWLSNCAPDSHFYLIDSWRPYGSIEDLGEKPHYRAMDNQTTDAFLSSFLETKRIEEERETDGVEISLIRTKSKKFLESLPADSFDFIYIDGDHKYDGVKNDIVQAKRLVSKKFGMICGDDLDLKPSPELYEIAKKFPRRDYIEEGGNHFHPGVLAAVHEEFSAVNIYNGFWWTAFINGKEDPNSVCLKRKDA